MYLRNILLLLCAALGVISPSGASAADFNVAVASRVISFRQPTPARPISTAILFDPANPASVAEAAAIERGIGGGTAAGKGTLRVQRVPVSQIGMLAGFSVAFVTSGLRDSQADIARAARKGSILTITSDIGCVQAGHCAVAVSSGQKVQITVSRSACHAARIQFNSAFLMLVKEL